MTKKNSIAKQQLIQASILGTIAFNNGIKRAPFYDTTLHELWAGRGVGETPNGEASTVQIMKAWINSWDAANIANAWNKVNTTKNNAA